MNPRSLWAHKKGAFTNMQIRQHARDLAKAGFYLCCIVGLVSTAVRAGSAARQEPTEWIDLGWVSPSSERSDPAPTRISTVVANAREIREALAKPIPRPDPLPPITAKLAYGHLKPGGKGMLAVAGKKTKVKHEALDAMAQDTSWHRSSSIVAPELHKIY